MLQERIEDLPRYLATRAQVPGEAADRPARIPGQQLPLDDVSEHGRTADGVDAADVPSGQPVAAPEIPAEQLVAPRELLLSLTAPWQVGPGDADRLAPKLAAVATERGWAFGEELRRQLMANPGGGQNYLWLLEHKRIAALPDRSRQAARRRPAGARPFRPECASGTRTSARGIAGRA
ncbi:hypothetical protein ABZ070_36725 [Streptomyces sp. NPDC006283]|uniref:hypothetical protein n=1 Tax=Streptomyces sp. NPDC006283 TaxID=3156741 RepID=UPI0033AE207F